MARRGKNEGTIYQLPSGSWRAQIFINGIRLGETRKSKTEAQKWLRDTLGEVDRGFTGLGSNVLLSSFLNEWLSLRSTAIKASTSDLYECTIRNHIIPYIKGLKLSEITPQKIQWLYLKNEQDGVGKRTIRVIHSILNSSLAKAVKLGAIHTNPVQVVPPPIYENPEMSIYSEFEITQLLIAVRDTPLDALVHLAITTGMRQSELLALKWSDINWERNYISVGRQLLRKYKNRDFYASLKTRSGKRTISIGISTIQKLRGHQRNQSALKTRTEEHWQDNDLVFPSNAGTPMHQRNLLRLFKKILNESGLREIRFHDLRHTSASMMLNNGISPIIVAKRLGHSKVSITLDTYGHLIPEMQQESANYIDNLITPIAIELHTNCTRAEEKGEIGKDTPNIKGAAG